MRQNINCLGNVGLGNADLRDTKNAKVYLVIVAPVHCSLLNLYSISHIGKWFAMLF